MPANDAEDLNNSRDQLPSKAINEKHKMLSNTKYDIIAIFKYITEFKDQLYCLIPEFIVPVRYFHPRRGSLIV